MAISWPMNDPTEKQFSINSELRPKSNFLSMTPTQPPTTNQPLTNKRQKFMRIGLTNTHTYDTNSGMGTIVNHDKIPIDTTYMIRRKHIATYAAEWCIIPTPPSQVWASRSNVTSALLREAIPLLLAVGAFPMSAFGLDVTFTTLTPETASAAAAAAVNGSCQGGTFYTGGQSHPALWFGSAASCVDLTPPGATGGDVFAVSGSQQGGRVTVDGHFHAAVWSGSAASFVDLHPSGATKSSLNAVTATQQGGVVFVGDITRAGLWTGSSASYVDLTPAGASQAEINAMSGSVQAGSAFIASHNHAGLWAGTADSFLDLNPEGALASNAYGYDGSHEVGYAAFGGTPHAALWSDTAESFVDLNGSCSLSAAFAVSESWQVGYFLNGKSAQAALWNGTAESLINLTSYLGPDYDTAEAIGVWSDGNTVYIAGEASGPSVNSQAILWTVNVPEPKSSSLALVVVGGTAILFARERSRRKSLFG